MKDAVAGTEVSPLLTWQKQACVAKVQLEKIASRNAYQIKKTLCSRRPQNSCTFSALCDDEPGKSWKCVFSSHKMVALLWKSFAKVPMF